MRKHIRLMLGFGTWLVASTGVFAAELPKVNSPVIPATNLYHGTTVVDSYQWLEKGHSSDTLEWSRLQNERSRAYFDGLPLREGLIRRLWAIRGEESARYFGLREAGGQVFAQRFQPPAQQPVLVRIESLEAPVRWTTVFDPNQFSQQGSVSVDWFVPSRDGRLVAVSLSENGSEQGSLHFLDARSGKRLPDEIPRVQYPTGGGSAVWAADGSGVFYTRYPHPGERPPKDLNFYQQVWFHRLGSPVAQDRYETGQNFPRIAEIELSASPDGAWILATVANGDGGDYSLHLRQSSGLWRQICKDADGIKMAKFGRDKALYLLSLKDAPRGRILRLSLDSGDLASAKVIVPERKGVIQDFEPCESGLFVADLMGGPSELNWFPTTKRRGSKASILPISSVSGLQSWKGDELLFGNASYTRPFTWYSVNSKTLEPLPTGLSLTSPVSFEDIEVTREFARSKDGTRVPLNILRKKGTRLDGKNPTLLYGYGGYGAGLTPGFDATRRIWFDAGGIYVAVNLRGGNEYGEEWHKAGNLTRKQNVFDDFIASAEHLIKRGYTQPARLAVQGGSNGGLLMGAFLTQRPDLARAVVSQVGIYDMLRVELDDNGQFNITEFGTVKNPDHFRAIFAYSPYHRVQNGVNYPAVLLTTGEKDGRVNPAQSRKMAARLQAATGSSRPILYRSNSGTGHGIGSALKHRIAEQADILAFLFDQLGIDAPETTFP